MSLTRMALAWMALTRMASMGLTRLIDYTVDCCLRFCISHSFFLFDILKGKQASKQGDKDGINERGSLNSDGIYYGPLASDGIKYSCLGSDGIKEADLTIWMASTTAPKAQMTFTTALTARMASTTAHCLARMA
jgi:hypothetical protein